MATTAKRSSFPTLLLDPLAPTHEQAAPRYRLGGDWRTWGLPALFGVALLVISFVGWAVDATQFYFSYLVGWAFCLSITLGALFFVMVNHITKAYWVVAVRRIPEVLTWSFPLLAVLSIPILLGMHDLYHWTHHELVDPASPTYDPLIAGKVAYLNTPFFVIRLALYFAVWSFLAFRLNALSVRQDADPDPRIPAKQRKTSAWGIPVFAVTTAFASYDLLMSLDPHWFSTIFGVYFFAGGFLAAIALVTLLAIVLQRQAGVLRETITMEHYHDLGKYLFAFTVFWAYIAFSQYMLIWYANIPEETIWYRHRLEHGWQYHSAALLIARFIIPFFVLLFRGSKRSIPVLAFMAVWILVMQWFDLHWIAMPVLDLAREGHAAFSWMSLTSWLGLSLLMVGAALYRLGRHSLVPEHDPLLPKSLRFENI